MNVEVKLDPSGTPYDLTGFTKRIDVWAKATDPIGRFSLLLNRTASLDLTKFFADENIRVRVDNAVILRGYLDEGRKVAKSTSSQKHLKQYKITGRDTGQDLGNKISQKRYVNQKADDILEDMLSSASSEILFSSPSSAPVLSYEGSNKHLVRCFREVLQRVNYDGYVSQAIPPSWSMFAIGTQSTGITLKAISEDAANNIIELDERTFFGEQIRNYILATGPIVNDHWTQENAADFGKDPANTVSNEYATVKVGGAAIKCIRGTGTPTPNCLLYLEFPKYNYNYLDWSTISNGTISFFIYFYTTYWKEEREVYIRLTDTENQVISYIDSTNLAIKEEWKPISAPVGLSCKIHPSIGGESGIWWQVFGSSFNWKVKKIEIEVSTGVSTDYIILDGLMLPEIQIKAVSQDGTSQGNYKVREVPLSCPDAKSQKELQDFADDQAEKRKDPLGAIMTINAKGLAGISGGSNLWTPGFTVVVNSPDDGINSVTYRILEVHHIISEDPITNGFDYVVELKLALQNVKIDTTIWDLAELPKHGILQRIHNKLLALEGRLIRSHTPGLRVPEPLISDRHVLSLFGRNVFFLDGKYIFIGEAEEGSTGYDSTGCTGSGSVAIAKDSIVLDTGGTAASVANLKGSEIIEMANSPEFQARFKISHTTAIEGVICVGKWIAGTNKDLFGFHLDLAHILLDVQYLHEHTGFNEWVKYGDRPWLHDDDEANYIYTTGSRQDEREFSFEQLTGTGVNGVTVKIKCKGTGSFKIKISNDGGSNWQTYGPYSPADPNTYYYISEDISAYIQTAAHVNNCRLWIYSVDGNTDPIYITHAYLDVTVLAIHGVFGNTSGRDEVVLASIAADTLTKVRARYHYSATATERYLEFWVNGSYTKIDNEAGSYHMPDSATVLDIHTWLQNVAAARTMDIVYFQAVDTW